MNARKARSRRDDAVDVKGARTYGVVAGVMAVTFALAIVLAVMDQLGGGSTPDEWVLWVEVVLLLSFATFWVTQTFDFWTDGLPEDASVPVVGASAPGVRAEAPVSSAPAGPQL